MTNERTSLYLSVQTKRQLAHAARRLGKTQTQLVHEALTDYLAKLEQPELTFIGAGEDTAVAGRTSEAWLRKQWRRPRQT